MSGRDSDSSIGVMGTGEFQRKDWHVLAEIEMRGEVIARVDFTCVAGGVPPEAAALVELLAGRNVHEALRLLAADRETGDRGSDEGREVLVEAFLRAVETCLDQQ